MNMSERVVSIQIGDDDEHDKIHAPTADKSEHQWRYLVHIVPRIPGQFAIYSPVHLHRLPQSHGKKNS
jgi:hypothetical protein